MANAIRPTGVPAISIVVLMSAVFTVSVSFSVVLPLLPYLVERLLGEGATVAQVSRHTGFLTGAYTLTLFLFAPFWGWLSDRLGRRNVLLVGLLGFGITTLIFSLVESLAAVYVQRFLSGMFAAAVAPVAAAAISEFASTEQGRGRRLAFISMASITGFLLGPMLSVFITRIAAKFFTITLPVGSVAIPLVTIALLAIAIAIAVAFLIKSGKSDSRSRKASSAEVDINVWIVPKLLALIFIVSAGVGAFEVSLALRGKQELGLTAYQIALMFTECSLVMLVMQAIVFSPWIKPNTTRWLIPPALAILSAGLFLVPHASSFTLMLLVIGGVSASAGILSPILTYWISNKAGGSQGWELGKQTAAASLGVTAGSAIGGLVFKVAILQSASFILIPGLTVLGFFFSLGLPHLLLPRDSGSRQE